MRASTSSTTVVGDEAREQCRASRWRSNAASHVVHARAPRRPRSTSAEQRVDDGTIRPGLERELGGDERRRARRAAPAASAASGAGRRLAPRCEQRQRARSAGRRRGRRGARSGKPSQDGRDRVGAGSPRPPSRRRRRSRSGGRPGGDGAVGPTTTILPRKKPGGTSPRSTSRERDARDRAGRAAVVDPGAPSPPSSAGRLRPSPLGGRDRQRLEPVDFVRHAADAHRPGRGQQLALPARARRARQHVFAAEDAALAVAADLGRREHDSPASLDRLDQRVVLAPASVGSVNWTS